MNLSFNNRRPKATSSSNPSWRFFVVFLLQLGLSVTAHHAVAQTEPRVHGDWAISCPDDGDCRLAQSIVLSGQDQPILQARVFGGSEPTMLLTFPLGVLLSTGWEFQVDDGPQTRLPYEICNVDGCHIGLVLDATRLQSFRRGNTLNVTFYDAAQAPVELGVSLQGFTRGWEALNQ